MTYNVFGGTLNATLLLLLQLLQANFCEITHLRITALQWVLLLNLWHDAVCIA